MFRVILSKTNNFCAYTQQLSSLVSAINSVTDRQMDDLNYTCSDKVTRNNHADRAEGNDGGRIAL
jgi:hypothetical protein